MRVSKYSKRKDAGKAKAKAKANGKRKLTEKRKVSSKKPLKGGSVALYMVICLCNTCGSPSLPQIPLAIWWKQLFDGSQFFRRLKNSF